MGHQVECAAYKQGNWYIAKCVKQNFGDVSNYSLPDAQRNLEASLEEFKQIRGNNFLDHPDDQRPLVGRLKLRFRMAASSILSLVRPIEHAHWTYRDQPIEPRSFPS